MGGRQRVKFEIAVKPSKFSPTSTPIGSCIRSLFHDPGCPTIGMLMTVWADRGADPGDVIVAAILQAMGRRDGVMALPPQLIALSVRTT